MTRAPFVFAVALSLAQTTLAASAGRPNIMVIIADDLGYADVGFNGCRDIPTPNIDRLAHEGIRCTSGYVTHPFCSPSRAGLLTGRYQQRFGHENNPTFLPRDEQVGLPTDQVTLADVLASAGYVSSMVGKWHLGAAEPFHPLNRGFTHMYGFLGGGHQYFPDRLKIANPSARGHEYSTKLLRDRERVEEEEYLTDAFSREAAAFIDRNHDQPFFLYLSYNAPHTPLQATEKYLQRFEHISDPKRRVYAAMVSAVDDGVGRVLDALDRHRIAEKTCVVFLSDNGGPFKVNGSQNTPLRDGKGSVYEGGIRVPFAVRWTGHLPAGEDFDHPVSALDIFATAAAMAEAEVPASHKLDGVNILPHLRGDVTTPPHDVLFWRRGGGESYAVRRGDMKLTEQTRGKLELYNLAADVGEQRDLAEEQPETLRELDSLKQKWNAELVQPRWQNPQAGRNRRQEPAAQKSEQPATAITNSIGMKFRRIPAGEFLMGSARSDPGARDDEQPRHRVRISKPFYLGIYEVTQAEFEQLMGTNPSSFTRTGLLIDKAQEVDVSRLPVDNVTWYAAVEFCRRLSSLPAEKEAGRVYRLPTEAEWEYACRAGTTTVFYFGNTLSSTQANFNGEHPFGNVEKGPFLNRTATVGSYQPNAFGLYDMHGNLHEWCLDRFDRHYYREAPAEDPKGPPRGTYRVIRGGDWYSDGRDCRSAFRYADLPEGRFYALGMRVVCELTSEGAVLDPVIAGTAEPNGESSTPAAATATFLAGKPAPNVGEDWPRWRGPRGDGSWHAPKLPATWPAEGLQRVWQRELGGGYGGIAVSGDRVFVMDRQREPEDVERVLCYDAVSGESLWSHRYRVDYSGVSYDNGPRATPTVFQNRVYTLGAVGHLFCLDAASGKPVWSKDLVGDFGARVPIWGLSASPVVFEDLLIVHPGAEPDGCFIAFDLNTGTQRWRSLPDPAGYATPILIEHRGKRQLVAWTPTNVRGLDPATGEALWAMPFEVNYGTSIASPIFQKDLVLVSSYYEGSMAIRLGDKAESAEVAWHDHRNLRGLMMQPLYRDGYVYLLDKRHGLTCVELATGKKVWDDDNRMTPKGRNPQATMVWLGDEDRAIVLNSDGDLILVRLNPKGYLEETRTNIIGRTWAHPAYAGNCVYARSDTEIVCVLLPPAGQ